MKLHDDCGHRKRGGSGGAPQSPRIARLGIPASTPLLHLVFVTTTILWRPVSRTMRLLALLVSLLPLAAATSTADVFFWPVAAPQPSLLARVAYDPASLDAAVLSFSPPASSPDGSDLVRIGFFTPSKQWVGGLASWSSLLALQDDKKTPTLRLHLGPGDELYHVDLSSSSSSSSSSAAKKSSAESGLRVELVRPDAGPRPQLNKPVVLGPDGKTPEEVKEKTFFQK